MRTQTKSSLLKSMQTLGIVFAMLFGMAFACEPPDPPPNNSNMKPGNIRDKILTGNKKIPSDEIIPNIDETPNLDRTSSGGRCSTENEFRQVITRRYEDVVETNVIEKEVTSTSLQVGKPKRFTSAETGRTINTDRAYPVQITFNLFRTVSKSPEENRTFVDTYVKSEFMCYINSQDECYCHPNGNNEPVESDLRWKNQ